MSPTLPIVTVAGKICFYWNTWPTMHVCLTIPFPHNSFIGYQLRKLLWSFRTWFIRELFVAKIFLYSQIHINILHEHFLINWNNLLQNTVLQNKPITVGPSLAYMARSWKSKADIGWIIMDNLQMHEIFLWSKSKAVLLQAWSGWEGSRKLRCPDFMTTAQDGGKVVSLTHLPSLPPGNTPGTHFCYFSGVDVWNYTKDWLKKKSGEVLWFVLLTKCYYSDEFK
jgi:hypothetical protein